MDLMNNTDAQTLESLSPALLMAATKGARLTFDYCGSPNGITLGNLDQADKARKEWEEAADKLKFREDRQALHIKRQREQAGTSSMPWDYTVSTNSFGHVCGCHFRSNMRGGRYGETMRGIGLDEAVEYGAQLVLEGRDTVTLRLNLDTLTGRQLARLLSAPMDTRG